MANAKFGGEMTFTLSTGRRIVVRANVAIEASRYNNGVVTNQDGSNTKTVELKPYRYACSFEEFAGAVDWDALLKETGINATLVEDYTKTRHLWTSGFFEGTPSVDRMTGEVTGLTFVSNKYQKVAR